MSDTKNTLVCVAKDINPEKALGELCETLPAGWGSFKVFGKACDDWKFGQEVLAPGNGLRLIVGMASDPANSHCEIAAIEKAVKTGVSFAMFSDVAECWQRPAFAPYAKDCSLLFIQEAYEMERARELFPNATIIVSGIPKTEQIKMPSPVVGSRLDIDLSLAPKDKPRKKIILVSLSKIARANLAVLEPLSAAHRDGAFEEGDEEVILLATRHPRDRNPNKTYRLPGVELYRGPLKTHELLARTDVVCNALSSEIRAPIHLRIPCFWPMYGDLLEVYKEVNKSEHLPPEIQRGAVVHPANNDSLITGVKKALHDDIYRKLVTDVMKKVYPELPAPGSCSRIFNQALAEWVKPKTA